MSTRLCKASRERSPESVTNPGGRIVSNRDEMKKKKVVRNAYRQNGLLRLQLDDG